MALCEVGATGLVRTKDKALRATVLAVANEHARCKLADGRTVWVPIANIEITSRPAVPAAPSRGAAVPPAAAPIAAPALPVAAPVAIEPPAPSAPSDAPASATKEKDVPVGWGPLVGVYAGLILAAWVCSPLHHGLLFAAFSAPFFLWRIIAPRRAKRWLAHVVIAFAASHALYWGPILIIKHRRQQQTAAPEIPRTSPLPAHAPVTAIPEKPKKTYAIADCELRAPEDWTRTEPPPWKARWALMLTDPQSSVSIGLLREPVESLKGARDTVTYATEARRWFDSDFVPKENTPRAWSAFDNVTIGYTPALVSIIEGFKGNQPFAYRTYSFTIGPHFYRFMLSGPPSVVGRPTLSDPLRQIVASLNCMSAAIHQGAGK